MLPPVLHMKPAWSWEFLRPLGFSLSFVKFLIPGEIVRNYARELAAWNLSKGTELELWPGTWLKATAHFYPPHIVVKPRTDADEKSLKDYAAYLEGIEKSEEVRMPLAGG
jgi:hypothetical protein